MLNVDLLNCSSSTNQDLCCRSQRVRKGVRKRKRTCDSPHSPVTCAPEKMDFSTPCDHRTAPMVLDEEESPILASVDTENKMVSWELLPGDIESTSSELALPSKTGNSREMDAMALTPNKRVETSEDFEIGANTYMDLAMKKNILHNSLPADLNIIRPKRERESNNGVDDEFIKMIEGLNLENWSFWSVNDSSGSPERVKRLESFLNEWNRGNDQTSCEERALSDSSGSIINNLARVEVNTDALASDNTIPLGLEDIMTTEKEVNQVGVHGSNIVKKKLIFGKNVPLHILQQKGTPGSARVVKRKMELTVDLNETPGKRVRTKAVNHTDTTVDNGNKGNTKKGRKKKDTKIPVPQNQPLTSTAMKKKKSQKSSTGSFEPPDTMTRKFELGHCKPVEGISGDGELVEVKGEVCGKIDNNGDVEGMKKQDQE